MDAEAIARPLDNLDQSPLRNPSAPSISTIVTFPSFCLTGDESFASVVFRHIEVR
jgi:hypothetical protein